MLTGPMQQQFVERILSNNPEIRPEMRDMIERVAAGAGFRVVSMILAVCVYTVFGMLGGLLGVAIFRRNVPPPPPPGTVDVLPPE
jgi:hypothetical protein